MTYTLAPGISFGLVDGRPVFMSVNKDRYFCLPPALEACFLGLTANNGPLEDRHERALLAFGILNRGCTRDGIVPCSHQLPKRSLWPTGGASHFPSRAVFQALLHLLIAALLLRLVGLERVARIVTRLKERYGRTRSPAPEILSAILSGYRQAVLLTTTHDQCLRISVAMTLQLARLGYAPTWCFGVSAAPFSAHSWVEIDGLLLSDECEHVDRYTPVAVY